MLIFQVFGSWAYKETTAVPPTPSSYSWVWAQVNLSSSNFVPPSQKKITRTLFWATIRNMLQVQDAKTELLQHRNWLWVSDTTKTVNDNQIIIQIHWQYVPFKESDKSPLEPLCKSNSQKSEYLILFWKCACLWVPNNSSLARIWALWMVSSFRVEHNPWWGCSTARDSLNSWNVFASTQLLFCNANIKLSTIFLEI